MVEQLAPLREHERALLVRSQLLRGEAHDFVGHGASLWDMGHQGLRSRPGFSPSAQPGLTRGTGKPLRLTPGVQPKGSEKPSSYSAGSQRT